MPKKSRNENSRNSSKSRNSSNSNKQQNQRRNNRQSLEKMKMEIANDFGVKLGGESSSKENGKVGGEMVKRLVDKALCDNSNKNSR